MNFATFMPQLLQWIAIHPTGAGLIVFITAFSESLAFIGIIFPGAVMMFGFGALIAADAMEFWPTLIYAIMGAISGDIFSFWLGHHFNERLRTVWPFVRHPDLLAKGIDFFQHHGGKSILLGRFIGPVRPVIPLVAGMLHMLPLRFLAVDILAAVAWGPAYLLPGVVFGASLNLAAEVASRLVVLLVGVVGSVWFIVFTVQRLLQLLQPRATALLNAALRFNARHPLYGQLGDDLLDPTHPEAKTLLILGLLLVGGTLLFSKVLMGIVIGGSNLDHWVYHFLQDLRTPWGDEIFIVVTALGNARVILVLVSVGLIYLLWHRLFLAAGHWLAAVIFGTVATYLCKFILQIPRPVPNLYQGIDNFSFPSLHTVSSTVVFGFLAIVIARAIRQAHWRWIPYTIATILVVAIAFSRIYLGAHWLSDVVAGFILGVIWVTVLGIAYYRHRPPALSWAGFSVTLLCALLIAGTWHMARFQEAERQRYARAETPSLLDSAKWWLEGWRDPRDDAPSINFQWAGPLAPLQEHLATTGWQLHPTFTAASLLRVIAPNPSAADLPLIPQLLHGRIDTLRLVRATASQWWVLRLWATGVHLTPGDTPIWQGYVNCLEPWHPLPWLTVLRTGNCLEQARVVLESSLAGWELRTDLTQDGWILRLRAE